MKEALEEEKIQSKGNISGQSLAQSRRAINDGHMRQASMSNASQSTLSRGSSRSGSKPRSSSEYYAILAENAREADGEVERQRQHRRRRRMRRLMVMRVRAAADAVQMKHCRQPSQKKGSRRSQRLENERVHKGSSRREKSRSSRSSDGSSRSQDQGLGSRVAYSGGNDVTYAWNDDKRRLASLLEEPNQNSDSLSIDFDAELATGSNQVQQPVDESPDANEVLNRPAVAKKWHQAVGKIQQETTKEAVRKDPRIDHISRIFEKKGMLSP